MIRLNCDYGEGAHHSILQKLMETNLEQTAGYGEDSYCEKAAAIIKKLCQNPDASVHFLVGGTQTNLIVIRAALRPHQCVLCANTGHINVHETGAIESGGHKVIALPSLNGKITAQQIKEFCIAHYNDETHEHMTQPKMVYLSNTTELGTIYYKRELEQISKVCKEYKLYLFIDGARLGYGLCAKDNNLDFSCISHYSDVFSIGGTKVGALFGEAVVITNPMLKEDFRYIMKQNGGLLAKGRLLGIQFIELFQNELYFQLATHANELAMILKNGLIEAGYLPWIDSYTNQQFFILPNIVLDQLKEKYCYAYQQKMDQNNSIVRFCTSWATKKEDIVSFLEDIRSIKKNL